MAIKSNYKKTFLLEKENSLFVVFNDYDNEDDFSRFLNFLRERLGVTLSEPTQYPYSIATEILFDDEKVIAMFHDAVGCCVRVDPGQQSLAKHIVQVCYGND